MVEVGLETLEAGGTGAGTKAGEPGREVGTHRGRGRMAAEITETEDEAARTRAARTTHHKLLMGDIMKPILAAGC
jgi:hypothetical protein